MQIWEQLKSWLRGDWSGPAIAPVDAALREVQQWREQLVHGLLLAVVYVGPLALAFSAYGALLRGHTALIVAYLIAYAAVLVFAFWRKVPYNVQVLGVLALIYLLGLSDLLVHGWKEDARLFFLSLTLLTSLFYGVYQGFMALGLAMLTLVSIGMLGVSGVLPLPPVTEPYLIGYTPVSLVSDTVSLALLSTMLIIVQRYLIPRFITAVAASREQVAALEVQQAELNVRAQGIQQVNYALQRRVFLLEGAMSINHETSPSMALAPLLSRAVETLAGTFELRHAGLYLLDEDDTGAARLTLHAATSEAGQRLIAAGYRIAAGETLVGRVWSERRSRILTPRDSQEPWRLPEARSAVLLPLVFQDRGVGVLDLQSLEADAFDADDLRVLELVAEQIAAAIVNAYHVRDEAALLEASSPFYRLAQRFAHAKTDVEVYTAIFETVREYSPYRAFVLTPSEDGARATLVAELRGEKIRFPDLLYPLTYWFAEEALLPAALELERPLLVGDVAAPDAEAFNLSVRDSLAQLAARGQLRSLALAPIRYEGRLLAVLGVVFNVLHVFTVTEAQLYQTLMELSGAALQRLMLIRAAQRRVEMEQQLRGFSDQLADIFDLQLLAAQAARTLQTLVNVDGVLVNVTPGVERVEEEA